MASRSLNKVILIGNLTRDPELKYTPAGTAVCTFGVATNRSWKTADGETKEDTQFHRIVAWQKLAELCGKLLNKGRRVYLEGRLVYRTFTGRDGQQRTISEIVLDDFIVFGDGRKVTTEEEIMEAAEAKDEPMEEATPDVESKSQEEQEKESEKKAKTEKATKEDSKEEAKKKEENAESENVNPDDIPF